MSSKPGLMPQARSKQNVSIFASSRQVRRVCAWRQAIFGSVRARVSRHGELRCWHLAVGRQLIVVRTAWTKPTCVCPSRRGKISARQDQHEAEIRLSSTLTAPSIAKWG